MIYSVWQNWQMKVPLVGDFWPWFNAFWMKCAVTVLTSNVPASQCVGHSTKTMQRYFQNFLDFGTSARRLVRSIMRRKRGIIPVFEKKLKVTTIICRTSYICLLWWEPPKCQSSGVRYCKYATIVPIFLKFLFYFYLFIFIYIYNFCCCTFRNLTFRTGDEVSTRLATTN